MATKNFNSPNEMAGYFNGVLEKVIDEVSDNLLKHMHEILDEFMYSGHTDATYQHYYKKGGFWSGWTIDKSKDYVRTLIFDPSKLALPGDLQGTHAGNEKEHDVRALMPKILDDDGTDLEHARFPGGSNYKGSESGFSYWDMFQTQLNQKVREWFDEALIKYGIRRG